MNSSSSTSDATTLFSVQYGDSFGSLLLTECIIGIVGNLIVVFAFARKLVPLTPFCMLLLNLSVADIFADIVFIPWLFRSTYQLIGTQSAVCGLFKFGILTSLGFRVNVCTVAYISCIRIKSIEKGRSKRILQKRVVSCYVLGTWIIAVASTLPLSFMIKADPKTGSCEPKYKSFYTLASTFHALFYFIPQIILVVNFARTIWHIWKTPQFEQSILVKKRKRIGFLLLSLTTAYIVCFIPILVWQMMRSLGNLPKRDLLTVHRIGGVMGYLTTISDPVLYALCWSGFRQGFVRCSERTAHRSAALDNTNQERGISVATAVSEL